MSVNILIQEIQKIDVVELAEVTDRLAIMDQMMSAGLPMSNEEKYQRFLAQGLNEHIREIFLSFQVLDESIRQELKTELNKTTFGAEEIAHAWRKKMPKNENLISFESYAKVAILSDLFNSYTTWGTPGVLIARFFSLMPLLKDQIEHSLGINYEKILLLDEFNRLEKIEGEPGVKAEMKTINARIRALETPYQESIDTLAAQIEKVSVALPTIESDLKLTFNRYLTHMETKKNSANFNEKHYGIALGLKEILANETTRPATKINHFKHTYKLYETLCNKREKNELKEINKILNKMDLSKTSSNEVTAHKFSSAKIAGTLNSIFKCPPLDVKKVVGKVHKETSKLR